MIYSISRAEKTRMRCEIGGTTSMGGSPSKQSLSFGESEEQASSLRVSCTVPQDKQKDALHGDYGWTCSHTMLAFAICSISGAEKTMMGCEIGGRTSIGGSPSKQLVSFVESEEQSRSLGVSCIVPQEGDKDPFSGDYSQLCSHTVPAFAIYGISGAEEVKMGCKTGGRTGCKTIGKTGWETGRRISISSYPSGQSLSFAESGEQERGLQVSGIIHQDRDNDPFHGESGDDSQLCSPNASCIAISLLLHVFSPCFWSFINII
jgi:hypothetical protein